MTWPHTSDKHEKRGWPLKYYFSNGREFVFTCDKMLKATLQSILHRNYLQTLVCVIRACAHLCLRVCVWSTRDHALSVCNWNGSSSRWCVCFKVVPGIRTRGGANPGSLLPWWERIPLVCTRSVVRCQRPRTTEETTGLSAASNAELNRQTRILPI